MMSPTSSCRQLFDSSIANPSSTKTSEAQPKNDDATLRQSNTILKMLDQNLPASPEFPQSRKRKQSGSSGKNLHLPASFQTAGSPSAGTEQSDQSFPARYFKAGDLVYGIEKGANSFDKGREHYVDHVFNSQVPCRIDNYRVFKNDTSGSLHQNLSPEEKEKFLAEETRFLDSLKQHEKYKSVVVPDDSKSTEKKEESNSALRRKSKGGLHWATFVEQKHVHFVLDSLDIKAVITKSYSGKENADKPKGASSGLPTDSKKNRSITGSELRWIYRNRDKSPVKEHIHFWLDEKHCSAPWEKTVNDQTISGGTNNETPPKKGKTMPEPALWTAYQPRNSS